MSRRPKGALRNVVQTHLYPGLSQELHYRASAGVARMLCEGEGAREALLEAAMPLADAGTEAARRRAAATVLTRLGVGRRRRSAATGLHRLLASLPEPAGRQLLTYVVAEHEPFLAATAREVLYPYFVERRTPGGFTTEEFSALNANGLFRVAGAITQAAVVAYAQKHWGISDPSHTRRALRILRKGGILGSTWLSRSGARCLGHFPVLRVPDIACFAYTLYRTAEQGPYIRLDRLWSGLLVHVFLVEPVAVDFLLSRAEADGLIAKPRAGTADLVFGSLEAAAAVILQAHHAER